jgi:tetratricopeptide (TPR) repeat protein
MLGNYQKAIDDYYLALETDSKRKTIYRNFGRVLGLNNEPAESERLVNHDNSANFSSKSNIDNLNIDGDINHYVYSQLNDLAIRSTSNIINLKQTNEIEKKSVEINKKNNNKNFSGNKSSTDFLSDNSYTGMSYNTGLPAVYSHLENEEDFENNNFSKNNLQLSKVDLNNKLSNTKGTYIENKDKDKKKKLEKWEICHAQGYAARKKENYDIAIDCYTQALKLNQKYFKALFNRGFAYDKIGDFDKAIIDYSQAIDIEPNNPYAYYNRAISYDKKGDIEKTIEDFSASIKLLPTKIDFYLNRAYAFRKLKDYQNAIKDYSDVIMMDRDNIKVNSYFYLRDIIIERYASKSYLNMKRQKLTC